MGRILSLAFLAVFVAATPAWSQPLRKVLYLLPAPLTLPAFGPWVLARSRGYFRQEGLDVVFQLARGGVDVAKQVGAGNAVVGGAIGDTPIMVRANGVPVRAVAVLGGGGLMQLVINADRGITGLADLKGRVITTMAYQDTTFFALLGMLATVGLTKNDVNAQAVGPVNVWKLFAAGQADAMASTPDWTYEVRRANPSMRLRVIPSDSVFKSMAQAIIVADDTINHDPELVQRLVRATLRGMKAIMDDPAGAAADYVKALPEHADDLDGMISVFKGYDEFVYPGQSVLGAMDPARLASLQKFYLAQGLIERSTPVDELYTNRFVEPR